MQPLNIHPLFLALGLSACVAMTGCEKTESLNVRTDAMFANFEVTAKGDGRSEVKASLRVGGMTGTYIELQGGDRLVCSSGNDQGPLAPLGNFLNIVEYGRTLTGDQEGKSFRIAFERFSNGSAPNSQTTMPAPFRVEQPAPGTTFSRAKDDILLTWSPPSADRIHIQVSGDCIQGFQTPALEDKGRYAMAAGSLRSLEASQTATCPIQIEVRRVRAGSVDPAFGKGGRFDAVQTRSISVSSAP